MRPYLHLCDAISVHSELNRTMIRRVYGEEIAQKTTLLYFGQTGYADIDRRASASRPHSAARALASRRTGSWSAWDTVPPPPSSSWRCLRRSSSCLPNGSGA